MTGNEIRDPHDPDAEPHAEDPIEHDRPATAELQDLLDARNHGTQQKISDPEDAIERASEDDSLQIDWAVVAPSRCRGHRGSRLGTHRKGELQRVL